MLRKALYLRVAVFGDSVQDICANTGLRFEQVRLLTTHQKLVVPFANYTYVYSHLEAYRRMDVSGGAAIAGPRAAGDDGFIIIIIIILAAAP
jgi:hypothetical protein